MQIILKDIVLFGYHGVHELERMVGTHFRMNVLIDCGHSKPIHALADTLDYASVFTLVKNEFQKTEALLEVLIERIIQSLFNAFSEVKSVDISIVKLNPPIAGFQGEVGVRLKKNRE